MSKAFKCCYDVSSLLWIFFKPVYELFLDISRGQGGVWLTFVMSHRESVFVTHCNFMLSYHSIACTRPITPHSRQQEMVDMIPKMNQHVVGLWSKGAWIDKNYNEIIIWGKNAPLVIWCNWAREITVSKYTNSSDTAMARTGSPVWPDCLSISTFWWRLTRLCLGLFFFS